VKEKDTKTHQSQRVALDEITAEILAEHQARCEQRAAVCGVAPDPRGLSSRPRPAEPSRCCRNTVSGRVSQLSKRSGWGWIC